MNPALQGLITIVLGVGGCIAYFYLSNQYIDRYLLPGRDSAATEAQAHRWQAPLITFVGMLVILLVCTGLAGLLSGLNAGAGWNAFERALDDIVSIFQSRRAVLACLIVAATPAIIAFLLLFDAPSNGGVNINRANMVRPWLFLAPALIALGLYLAYPVFATLWLSVTDRNQDNAFVGLANYRQMLSEDKFWEAIRNNMLWLIVVPAASTAFGLLAAQLTDRIRWGNFAKSLIFMPMAISFVGAAVIWKLIYDTRPVEQEQIGALNAVWLKFDGGPGSILILKVLPILALAAFAAFLLYGVWLATKPLIWGDDSFGRPTGWVVPLRLAVALGALWLTYICLESILSLAFSSPPYGVPQTWLTIPFANNFFLMAVLVWIQTGFAMVILSAALRGIPEETIEAAIVDGANPFEIFFKIKVPQIMGTIVVVWTTITIVVLKIFDIVLAMTNGQWETQVLANYMYDKLFRAFDWGVGSAAAMVIMLLVSPILVWNVYNARKEMR